MKFGPDQLNKITPHRISILFDILASACGIVAAWVTSAAFISHALSDIVSSILTGLLIPMLLLFKRFFGADVPEGVKNVPIADVKEIIDK